MASYVLQRVARKLPGMVIKPIPKPKPKNSIVKRFKYLWFLHKIFIEYKNEYLYNIHRI
jgi:hypothetical protein